MTRFHFPQLGANLQTLPCPYEVRLVGVDGPAGAGKSTFARKLSRELCDAPIVEMDDFLAWDDLESFEARLLQQVVEPLFAGQTARYQVRDWERDNTGRGLREWKELTVAPVVLLEGVGSTRRALDDRLHYRVWVDAPAALRLQRGYQRDANIEGHRELWEAWGPMEADFFKKDETQARANIRIDGTAAEADGWFRTL